MGDPASKEEALSSRARWLLFSRIFVITVLLGITGYIQLKSETSAAHWPTSIYSIILLTYSLSFIYLIVLRSSDDLKLSIYFQSITDVALVTWLVWITGAIDSVYSSLYTLVIIYAVLFLERRGGILIATFSSFLYAALLGFEYLGVIHSASPTPAHHYDAGYVFSRTFVQIASFYIIAVLTAFVVERERKVRLLLSEKENAFKQLDVLHRSIIESVDTGILTIDLGGRIKSFNRAAEEITGLTHNDVENRTIQEIFPGIAEEIRTLKARDRKGSTRNRFEMTLQFGKDAHASIGFALSDLMNPRGETIGEILIFQDVTALKAMEKEVERNKRLALIGEMAACMAHEMRNPLASLSGSIQMLRGELRLNESDERLMRIVLRGKDQLEGLLKDFLLLARPGIGKREELSLQDVILNVIEAVQCSPEWRNDTVLDLNFCGSDLIYGNRNEIRQAILNPVLNAIQSMPPSGGKINIQTQPSYFSGDCYLDVKILDNGAGIEKKDLDKVFEPFYTTKERGTGLGLAIVNRIVQNHGGRVHIESEPNRGTVCTLSFPIRKSVQVESAAG